MKIMMERSLPMQRSFLLRERKKHCIVLEKLFWMISSDSVSQCSKKNLFLLSKFLTCAYVNSVQVWKLLMNLAYETCLLINLIVFSGCIAWWLATYTRNQRFPIGVRLLTMCRGGLSAVIVRLRSKCLWSGWKW